MLRIARLTVFSLSAAGLLLSLASARAAGPPKELYNKSVSMSWATGYNWKDVDGSSGHVVTQFNRAIYVSSAGRIFQMGSRHNLNRAGRATGVQSARAKGPDGNVIKTSNAVHNGVASWSGRTLTSVTKVDSGAFHLHVVFDESFNSCTLTFTSGKEAGAHGIVMKSMRGTGNKLVMLNPTGNSGMTCSVKPGNVFGQ